MYISYTFHFIDLRQDASVYTYTEVGQNNWNTTTIFSTIS